VASLNVIKGTRLAVIRSTSSDCSSALRTVVDEAERMMQEGWEPGNLTAYGDESFTDVLQLMTRPEKGETATETRRGLWPQPKISSAP
jgi:hypothetical protein